MEYVMRIRKVLIGCAIILVALIAASKVLPLVIDAAYPRMRASTQAFQVGSVRDGIYEGKAFLLPVSVHVRAVVSGGRIPAEAIVPRVIETQSLGVDVISGATHSSLTILKAIENALEKGTKP